MLSDTLPSIEDTDAEIVTSKERTPEFVPDSETVIGEIKNGYMDVSKVFPAGPKRRIHVNKDAVIANNKNKTTHWPTVVVVDENKYECHGLFVQGPIALKYNGKSVYLVTTGEIICYRHRFGKSEFRKETILSRFTKQVKKAPIISCLVR